MVKKSFGTVLRELRQERGYQQQDVYNMLEDMGIPTTKSQISRWENDRNKPNIEQFAGLCRVYQISDAYKVFVEQASESVVTGLNAEGMKKLNEYKELLMLSGKYRIKRAKQKIVELPLRKLPMYDLAVSAGPGQLLDNSDYEMVEVPADVPDNANFALRVSGNSMEPTLHDGQMICVCMQPMVEEGEIGVFFVDGNAYVKEFHRGTDGPVLISHNQAYEPIQIRDNNAKVFGKVVYLIG